MNTGCKQCDKNFIANGDRCPKHRLEYLKWVADTAQNDYLEELRNQSKKNQNRKGTRCEIMTNTEAQNSSKKAK